MLSASAPSRRQWLRITPPSPSRRKQKTLLIAIDDYLGSTTTKLTLQLLALTFVRPGELRQAEWTEFEASQWSIPGPKMKMKDPHIVPLAAQAQAITEQLRPLTGHSRYLFPPLLSHDRPMSENTLNTALRRLGFTKDEMTSHGFRTMASTRLNEMNWHPDAIERQLAHRPKNQVRAAYNQAQHLPERIRMMQAWADYLDGLRSNVSLVTA